jgi:hypothetical protein
MIVVVQYIIASSLNVYDYRINLFLTAPASILAYCIILVSDY